MRLQLKPESFQGSMDLGFSKRSSHGWQVIRLARSSAAALPTASSCLELPYSMADGFQERLFQYAEEETTNLSNPEMERNAISTIFYSSENHRARIKGRNIDLPFQWEKYQRVHSHLKFITTLNASRNKAY